MSEYAEKKLDKKLEKKSNKKKVNDTGLPDNLKAGIESMSGHALDDVKVHYNSNQPAQLNAHAYAQGSQIHVGPGQEKHLPHEAWHVVQQKQGKVKPTSQLKAGMSINDDPALEYEADVMGHKALQMKAKEAPVSSVITQNSWQPIQRVMMIEGGDVDVDKIKTENDFSTALNVVINEKATAINFEAVWIKDELCEMSAGDFNFETKVKAVDKAIERIKEKTPSIAVGVSSAITGSIDELDKDKIMLNLKREFKYYPGGLVALTRESEFAETLLEGIRTKQSSNWQTKTAIESVPNVEWTNDELKYWNVRHYTNKVMVTLGKDLGQGYFKVEAVAPPSFTEILSTATLTAMFGSGGSSESSSYSTGDRMMLANASGAANSGHTTSTDWVNIGNVGDTFYGLFYQDDPATGLVPGFIRDATYYAKWSVTDFGVGWASADWLSAAGDSRKEEGKTPVGKARGGELSDIIADIYPTAISRESTEGEGKESVGDKSERRQKFAAMTNFEVKKHGPMTVGEWIKVTENVNKLSNYVVDTNKGKFIKLKPLLPPEVQAQL